MIKHILFKLFLWLILLMISPLVLAQSNCNTEFQIENASEVLIKCFGETVTLTATQNTEIHNYKWYMEEDTTTLSSTHQLTVLDGGNYIVTALTSTGCRLYDTLFVVDFPKPFIDLGPDMNTCTSAPIKLYDPNIDSTEYQFLWSTGETTASIYVNSSDTYWVRITNTYRCSASDTIKVSMNPKPEVAVGGEKLICKGSSIQLNAFITSQSNSPYTFEWSPASSLSSSSIPNPVATPTAPTTYRVVLTDAKGCSDTAFVRVNVGEQPIASVAFSDTTVCANTPVQLQSAVSGGTPFNSPTRYHYSWTPTTGLTGANTPNPIASPSATTTYTLTVRDSAGCSTSATVKVNIPNIKLAISPGKNIELCQPEDLQLNVDVSGGTAAYSYQWEPAAMFNNASIANPIARLTTPGQFYFYLTVKDAKGCQARDSMRVTVNAPMEIETVRKQITVCKEQSVTLEARAKGADSRYHYQWSPADTRLRQANTATPVFTAPADFTGTLTYYVVASNEFGCTSNKDSVVIQIIDAPQVDLGSPDTVACVEAGVVLKNQKNSTGTHQWVDAETNALLSTQPAYTATKAGIYCLQITHPSTGCMNADTITLINPAKPSQAWIATESRTRNDKVLRLQVSSDGSHLNFEWSSNGAGKFAQSHRDTAIYIPAASDTGYIAFNAVAQNACGSVTATQEVYFEAPPSEEQVVFVPKFFSPLNEHPDNRVLKVFSINTSDEDFSFKVFNRWGEIVYHTSDFAEASHNGWNGNLHNSGVPLSAGPYTYTVQGKYKDGSIFNISGITTLLR